MILREGHGKTNVSDLLHSKIGGLSGKYTQGRLAASADISDHPNLGEGVRAYWYLGLLLSVLHGDSFHYKQ